MTARHRVPEAPSEPECLQSSRYTFAFPVGAGHLLYNANTGAVLHVTGVDTEAVAHTLSGAPGSVDTAAFPETLIADLIAGGMLLAAGTDEIAMVRDRYWRARGNTPLALTVTTTMDCNLGCYYCYEERSGAALQLQDVRAIVDLAATRLGTSNKRSLHIDWYGGEPLLNVEFLAGASEALQALCAGLGVVYNASIISNGTAWPDDVGAFIRDHAIRQVQISFDGMKEHHDKRRRYRSGRAPVTNPSSFLRAVALVDQLLDHTRVDVRFNMDRENVADLPRFLEMMRERGWFHRPFPVVVQPARLSAYSERSKFMRRVELSIAEFEEWRAMVRQTINGEVGVEESEVPDGFPFPRTSVCAALAPDSVVIGADGDLYRCGLQVGEQGRAVGHLHGREATARQLPILVSDDSTWWSRFDPTTQPKCSQCSFLPICWSGCPKKHLERDTHAVDEQGTYWRRNLGRLVVSGVGLEVPPSIELTLEDQFRGGM